MKRTVVALSMSLSGAVFAQDARAPAVNDPAVQKATDLLTKVHETYRDAAGIKETLTLRMKDDLSMPSQVIELTIGRDSGRIVARDAAELTWNGTVVDITFEQITDGYIEAPDKGGFAASVLSALESSGGLPGFWTIVLRENDDPQAWLDAFLMGAPDGAINGFSSKELDDGEMLDVIEIDSDFIKARVGIDKEYRVRDVEITMSGAPGQQQATTLLMQDDVSFGPVDIPPFEAGTRTKYPSQRAMMQAAMKRELGGGVDALDGKPAPDFTLKKLGGGEVTLSSLIGEVVVLDFWSTWCGPCKRGLPLLNDFAKWAADEGLKCRVFAVNIMERASGEKSTEVVKGFWDKHEYTVPVLLGSLDGALQKAYGISAIPVTVIVGTDGVIAAVHRGYSPDMVDYLRRDVTAALADG
jgi:thiol-disulfide isomerase/thioredoxin